MKTGFGRGVVGALTGVLPGVILVLLAQFVIEGEWQLTIGAPGVLIAVLGAIVGAVIASRRRGVCWWRRPGEYQEFHGSLWPVVGQGCGGQVGAVESQPRTTLPACRAETMNDELVAGAA